MPIRLDRIDKKILAALQEDGRMQLVDLAKRVGLSPSPCLRRVRRLEETGVIVGYRAVLDGSKVGAGFTLFTRVWFKAQDAATTNDFVAAIRDLPEIVECHLMAGECDALLRVVTTDLASYRRFHADFLTQIPSIQSVKTEVPMEMAKFSHAIPIRV